ERGIILANDGELIGVHHLTMNGDALPHNHAPGEGDDPFWSFMMGQVRKGAEEDWGARMLEAGLTHQAVADSLIAAALEQSGGNISKAARRIGLSRAQVSYWVAKRNDERSPSG
ncbi:MAG TPA: helix-turn-helix domain-containing protein, partial [Sphingomonadaceae bacterium]|nr:helix-turn-helix domain-containing protein [Sphingomonadaceae bacterium]